MLIPEFKHGYILLHLLDEKGIVMSGKIEQCEYPSLAGWVIRALSAIFNLFGYLTKGGLTLSADEYEQFIALKEQFCDTLRKHKKH